MFEGALCSFGKEIQNLNVYTINEVMIEVLNKQAVENKVHRTLFEARKVAGSATYKQIIRYCTFLRQVLEQQQQSFYCNAAFTQKKITLNVMSPYNNIQNLRRYSYHIMIKCHYIAQSWSQQWNKKKDLMSVLLELCPSNINRIQNNHHRSNMFSGASIYTVTHLNICKPQRIS